MKNLARNFQMIGLLITIAMGLSACTDGTTQTNLAGANTNPYWNGGNPIYPGGGNPYPTGIPVPTPTPVPPVTYDNNFMLNYWTTGSSAKVTVDSTSAANGFAGGTLDSPTLWRVNVDLTSLDNGTTYGGDVKIAFINSSYSTTNAQPYQTHFTSGTLVSDNIYNRNVNTAGHNYYKGFFEDADYNYTNWMDLNHTGVNWTYGAVILIVDLQSLDDEGSVNGELWYLNYNKTVCGTQDPYFCNIKPATRCWFISTGPYNCQDFLVGSQIRPDAVITPTRYQRLGTFQTLTKSKAFHQ